MINSLHSNRIANPAPTVQNDPPMRKNLLSLGKPQLNFSMQRSRQSGTELITSDLPLFKVEQASKLVSGRSVEKGPKVLTMKDSLHLSSAISEG